MLKDEHGDFCPVLWPEEPTPLNQRHCRECGLYQHGSRMVWGEGKSQSADYDTS